MDVAVGEQAYVENVGTVNVYNNDTDGAFSSDEQFGVPQENLESTYWSSTDVGGVRLVETGEPGARPGARPRITVVNTRYPGAFPGSDYQQVQKGYAEAYESVSGREPGFLPFIIVLTPLWVYLILGVTLILASMVVVLYLINKSTVNSVDAFTNAEGEDIYRTCIGTLIGGVSCYWYNGVDGTTTAAESTEGLGSTLETVVKYVAIAGAVIGGIYILAKVVPSLLPKKSASSEVSKLAVK